MNKYKVLFIKVYFNKKKFYVNLYIRVIIKKHEINNIYKLYFI